MSDYIIEFQGVSKHYHDHPVLHSINLEVVNGEFLTLLGPSGCGKTTLLRLLSGFEAPSQGKIFINGKDVTGLSPQERHVNTVFQSYALFPHMTVYDNVAFGLRCKRLPKDEIDDRVREALRMVKLSNLGNRKPDQLSGGQQQRVAIARAVVNQPLVLLLDEPLSSLDYRLRKTMQIELKQLQTQLGITFIFVTHDQEEALSMSDRVVVMQEGVIEQVGTPREVYEEPQNLRVAKFIGEVNIFEAKILQATSTKLEVEMEGQSYTLKNRKHYTVDDEICILIRPEDLQVWSQAEMQATDTKGMFPAMVEQVIYKGVTVDLMLRLPSQKVLAATQFFNEDDDKLDYRAGEQVWIQWLPGWEVILPDEK
jgi:spermidine/putrescine transport system ATP-binding protein